MSFGIKEKSISNNFNVKLTFVRIDFYLHNQTQLVLGAKQWTFALMRTFLFEQSF